MELIINMKKCYHTELVNLKVLKKFIAVIK